MITMERRIQILQMARRGGISLVWQAAIFAYLAALGRYEAAEECRSLAGYGTGALGDNPEEVRAVEELGNARGALGAAKEMLQTQFARLGDTEKEAWRPILQEMDVQV